MRTLRGVGYELSTLQVYEHARLSRGGIGEGEGGAWGDGGLLEGEAGRRPLMPGVSRLLQHGVLRFFCRA